MLWGNVDVDEDEDVDVDVDVDVAPVSQPVITTIRINLQKNTMYAPIYVCTHLQRSPSSI